MKKILILLVSTIVVAGCNVGGGLNPSISAAVIGSPSTCTGLTNNKQCTIQITYNTNGVSGVTLGTIPVQSSLPSSMTTNNSFIDGLTTCQNQVGTSSGNTTCSLTLTYTSNGGTNINLAFTLGTATSNVIQVSGD